MIMIYMITIEVLLPNGETSPYQWVFPEETDDKSSMYFIWLETETAIEDLLDSMMELINEEISDQNNRIFQMREESCDRTSNNTSINLKRAIELKNYLKIAKIFIRDICLALNLPPSIVQQFGEAISSCKICSDEFLLVLFNTLSGIETNIQPPDCFICGIGLEVMVDPVTISTPNERNPDAPHEDHFERSNIETWFGKYLLLLCFDFHINGNVEVYIPLNVYFL